MSLSGFSLIRSASFICSFDLCESILFQTNIVKFKKRHYCVAFIRIYIHPRACRDRLELNQITELRNFVLKVLLQGLAVDLRQ